MPIKSTTNLPFVPLRTVLIALLMTLKCQFQMQVMIRQTSDTQAKTVMRIISSMLQATAQLLQRSSALHNTSMRCRACILHLKRLLRSSESNS